MATIATKLFSGASYQTLNWVTTIIVSLFLTPYVISHLGNNIYGLWILVSSIFSFYGVLDFGLSVATQRAITQSLAINDIKGANTAVVTSTVVFCVVGLLAIFITAIILLSATLILNDHSLINEYKWTVALLGFSIAVIFPSYSISGIYAANFRIDISSRIHLIKFLFRSAVIYFALHIGSGVIVMALVTALTDIFAAVAMVLIATKLAPWIEWNTKFFDRKKLKDLADFGSSFLFVSICDRARGSFPSFAINHGTGLVGVTYFGIAQQMSDYYTRLIGNIVAVFQPLFINQQSSQQHDANSKDFIFVTEISLFVSIILALGIIGCAPEFFETWLGKEFEQSLSPTYILIISGIFCMGAQAAQQLMFAYSKQRQVATVSAIETIITLCIIFPAAHYGGLNGVALAIAIPTAISSLIIRPVLLRKTFIFDSKKYIWIIFKAIATITLLYWIIHEVRPLIAGHGYLRVMLIGITTLAIATPLSLFSILDQQTRKRLFLFVVDFSARK